MNGDATAKVGVRWGSTRWKRLTALKRMKLAQLLRLFGWRGVSKGGSHKRLYGLRRLNEAERYSVLEFVRGEYRRRIGRCHPDRGGSHEEAASLNAAMDRIEQLFRRAGMICLCVLLAGCGTEVQTAIPTIPLPPAMSVPVRKVALVRLPAGKAPEAPWVTLSWDSVAQADGYRVYYGYLDHTYSVMLDCGSQTSVTISNVSPFNLYYFAVTAYAAAGGESDLSEQKDYSRAGYQYPPGREQFAFAVEASADLRTWATVWGRIEPTNGCGFYRLAGRFIGY